MRRSQDRNLDRAGTRRQEPSAEAMEEHCLLACTSWLDRSRQGDRGEKREREREGGETERHKGTEETEIEIWDAFVVEMTKIIQDAAIVKWAG